MITRDWFAHTPKEVLAKNFDVRESDFAHLPTAVDHTRYIFQGKVPPLSSDKISNPQGERSFCYHFSAQQPVKTSGGNVRIVDSTNFPAASTIAARLVEVEPRGMREMHWHPNTDEWQHKPNRPALHFECAFILLGIPA